MSGFTFWGKDRIYMAAEARLIENEREIASAWAANHIVLNPAHSWILGKFVEADRANKNQQFFTLEGLQMGNPSIAHGPMNVNHNPRNVVGAFVASELIFPAETAGEEPLNPYIESLAVFWKYYFPDEYRAIQNASGDGGLFYSMECVPQGLSTIGGSNDATVYPYEGRQSPNYSKEINERTYPIMLHGPHFTGGALVIPPEKPAWCNADAQMVSQFLDKNWAEVEAAYEGIKTATPHLTAATWEALMMEIIGQYAGVTE